MRLLIPTIAIATLLQPCVDEAAAAEFSQLDGVARLIEQKAWTEADSIGTILLHQVQDRTPVDSLLLADLIDLIVRARVELPGPEVSRALDLAKRAVQIREKHQAPESLARLGSLKNLARVHHRLNQLDLALPLNQQILSIQEETLGPNHLDVAETLDTIGHEYGRSGDYEQSRLAFQRALEIRERTLPPDHLDPKQARYGRPRIGSHRGSISPPICATRAQRG